MAEKTATQTDDSNPNYETGDTLRDDWAVFYETPTSLRLDRVEKIYRPAAVHEGKRHGHRTGIKGHTARVRLSKRHGDATVEFETEVGYDTVKIPEWVQSIPWVNPDENDRASATATLDFVVTYVGE